ncbi:hypothetical protein, partial [Pseudomonas aeruginosa]|uniref:hypothetical protein n=1 Tax=Pseudomonas aeruginosa TaxID=287 RepID=UPI001F4B5635
QLSSKAQGRFGQCFPLSPAQSYSDVSLGIENKNNNTTSMKQKVGGRGGTGKRMRALPGGDAWYL